MYSITRLFVGIFCLVFILSVSAQADETYVFPAAGQSEEQQKKDEYECYLWAADQSGYDPVEGHKDELSQASVEADSANTKSGGAGKAALGAAARGAIIAEASDGDASKGATTGATMGLIKGKRRQHAEEDKDRAAMEEQARAEAEAKQKLVSNYERARAACLEAHDYVVK